MNENSKTNVLARPALLSAVLAVGFSAAVASMPEVQAVGVHKLTIVNTGARATCLSAPFHKQRQWRGSVTSVAGNVVTVDGVALPTAPGTELGRRLGNGTLNVSGFAQYIVIVRWDASATFPSEGNAGDWFYIDSNTGTTLTLGTGPQTPAGVGAGDRVEIIRLTSLRDVFGGPGSFTTFLNKDSNGAASTSEEDVLFYVNGTSFSTDVIYHDGSLAPEGYVIGGDGPFDGQYLTLTPDQAFFVFRKAATSAVTFGVTGQTHRAPLTHLFPSAAGSASVATAFGTGFPVNAPVGASQLHSQGTAPLTRMVYDSNGASSTAEEDVMFRVSSGSPSFDLDFIYHDGTLVPAVWVAGGNPDDTVPIESGRGYFFFRRPNLSTITYRQPVPFPR